MENSHPARAQGRAPRRSPRFELRMIELLALPGWQAPPTTLDDWIARLTALAGPVAVTRESRAASWLEIDALRLRGYVVLEGRRAEAINFELADPDPAPATRAIE